MMFTAVEGAGPPVVLLHAGGLDSRMFDNDITAIAQFAHVLRYDRSGSGRSPRTTGPVDRVRELHHVAATAFGPRLLVLVGSSFGAQLAVDFALAHPELVAALLLLAPGLTGVDPGEDLRRRMTALAAAAERGADALTAAWLADPHLASRGLAPAARELVRRMLRDNLELFIGPPTSAPSPSVVGRLHRLRAPGVVYIGGRDDAHHQAVAANLATTAQALALRRLPESGHYPSLECETWWPSAVRQVIRTLDSAS